METVKFDQLTKSWQQIAKNEPRDIPPDFELDVYKQMLNMFHVGHYYYFIFNLAKAEIEYVSDTVEEVLGINPQNFTPAFVYQNIHQEDQQRFVTNEQHLTTFFSQVSPDDFLKYKISYDYRLQHAKGYYIWIYQQMMALQLSSSGAIIRTLGVHTDISHLKTEQKPVGMTIVGMNGEPSYYNVLPSSQNLALTQGKQRFSQREKEVYSLVLSGLNTSEIAARLFISPQTVATHRKNILMKSGCANWIDFTSKALANSW